MKDMELREKDRQIEQLSYELQALKAKSGGFFGNGSVRDSLGHPPRIPMPKPKYGVRFQLQSSPGSPSRLPKDEESK